MQNKLLEDNIGESQDNFVPGDEFLDKTPKAQYMKEITDKLDFIKIKNFCSVTVSFKRIRR